MGKGNGTEMGMEMEIRMGKRKGMGIQSVPMALWPELVTCAVTCSVPHSIPNSPWHPPARRQECGWEHQTLWENPSSSPQPDFRAFCLPWGSLR